MAATDPKIDAHPFAAPTAPLAEPWRRGRLTMSSRPAAAYRVAAGLYLVLMAIVFTYAAGFNVSWAWKRAVTPVMRVEIPAFAAMAVSAALGARALFRNEARGQSFVAAYLASLTLLLGVSTVITMRRFGTIPVDRGYVALIAIVALPVLPVLALRPERLPRLPGDPGAPPPTP